MTLSYYCQAISIIAGGGNEPQKFTVRRIYLERSPTIQDWIRNPDTIPPSVHMDKYNNIYLDSCEPDVVQEVCRILCGEWNVPAEYAAIMKGKLPVFWLKVYKLAICLAIEPAATFAINNLYQYLDMHHCTAKAFLEALLVACSQEETLFQSPPIRDWIVAYISRNQNTLGSSEVLELFIRNSNEKTREVICMLMAVMAQLGQEMKDVRKDLEQTREELHKARETQNHDESPLASEP